MCEAVRGPRRGLGGSDDRGAHPRRRPRYPTAARDSVRRTRVRARFALPPRGGRLASMLVFRNDRWTIIVWLFGNLCVCVASCLRHVRCLRFFVRFSREGCGTSFRAAHTRRDHGRARQARHRPQAHPRLPRCAARHLRELHEVHRARYETSRKDTRKPHPSPNPRALFPFGTREPVPGRVSESRFSIRHPLGFERALRRSRLPVPHRSRAKTPLVPPQPPARPRSSSGSASSASCSWFLSCTKR